MMCLAATTDAWAECGSVRDVRAFLMSGAVPGGTSLDELILT